ncbi:MAG TPA: hypothetical protein VFC09_09855 [Candidatus Dormibacteraeota bacterium]|nr:hypothetical protein [Candidatus Dormibacteraeota bacterium]
MSTAQTTQYQFATLTSSSPEAVLDGVAGIELPESVSITERGGTYLVIGPRPSGYDARLAVALSTLLVLTVLILSAFSVVLIAFLPAAAAPLVPLLLRDSNDLGVGAVPEEDGTTRVTVHGQAPTTLTAALDLFLSRLPEPPPPPGLDGNGAGPPAGVAAGPVRAPEPTAAE